MATAFRACAVDGCKGNAHYKAKGYQGWCCKHYERVRRHGNSDTVLSPWGQAQDWIQLHREYTGDDCLTWPFSRNPAGYGYVHIEGATRLAHRMMCVAVHGEPEGDADNACHSCGRGHQGCVNPRHLRWDTHLGNMADMAGHGTLRRGERNHLAKLTPDDVRTIRGLAGKLSQTKVGKQFGIDQSNVSLIQRRKSWGWLT